ncbi:MAG: hypothetical protein A2005_01055 [Desulfuromonadales bacterium GWC2_61_20]|nr:MAG: hypothetical protein A2005_01055 [Desulfuromonadales bacterium GWC2_61_20]HAD03141.1 hypothetical protein [Desulfuromonas sp.]
MNKLKILRTISTWSFGALIALFMSSIFVIKLRDLLVNVFPLLFFTSLITELAYQLFSGIHERRFAKKKLRKLNTLPIGNYKITDKVSNADLGSFTNDEIDYLRKKFLENGMDDNGFYFDRLTFELFKEENPPAELKDKIETILKLKDPVEIAWSK